MRTKPPSATFNSEIARRMQAHFKEQETLTEKVLAIILNKFYLFLLLSQTCSVFVLMADLFWIGDYLMNTVAVPKENVYLFFGVTVWTAPLFGALLSSRVSRSVSNPHAQLGCSCLALFLATVLTLPISYLESFNTIGSLLWAEFFFLSFSLPITQGLLHNSVREGERPLANSIAGAFIMFFGCLLAPFMYALIQFTDAPSHPDSSAQGFTDMTYITAGGALSLFIAQIVKLSEQGHERAKPKQ